MVQHMLQVVGLKNIHLTLDDELQQPRMKKKKNASESASTSSEAVHFKPQTEAIKKQGTTTSNQ